MPSNADPRDHLATGLFAVLALAACAAPNASAPPVSVSPAPAAPPAAAPPAPPAAVARIDGQPVLSSDLDEHQRATGLPRQPALDDLIDLILLRAATSANGIALAAETPAPDVRAAAEFDLARKLGLPVSPAADVLVVDHAWVKDVPTTKQQAKQRALIDKLHTLCLAGEAIPAAYPKLGVAGTQWHIGDHEDYPCEVVPAAARDLPPGSLSPVIPGDGGLHLFKIIERKRVLPSASQVHPVVRDYLREGKIIAILGN